MVGAITAADTLKAGIDAGPPQDKAGTAAVEAPNVVCPITGTEADCVGVVSVTADVEKVRGL